MYCVSLWLMLTFRIQTSRDKCIIYLVAKVGFPVTGQQRKMYCASSWLKLAFRTQANRDKCIVYPNGGRWLSSYRPADKNVLCILMVDIGFLVTGQQA